MPQKRVSMEPRSKSSHSRLKFLSLVNYLNALGGVKGRRTLQYENTSLLKGKKIYLDLHGYKRASFIESGLQERGAVRTYYDLYYNWFIYFRLSKASLPRILSIS